MSLQKAFSFDGLVRFCFLQKDYILFPRLLFLVRWVTIGNQINETLKFWCGFTWRNELYPSVWLGNCGFTSCNKHSSQKSSFGWCFGCRDPSCSFILPCLGDCDGRITPSLAQAASAVAGFVPFQCNWWIDPFLPPHVSSSLQIIFYLVAR